MLWVTYLLVVEILGSSASSGTSGKFWEVLAELGFYHFHFFIIASKFWCRTFDSTNWFYPLTSMGKGAIVNSEE